MLAMGLDKPIVIFDKSFHGNSPELEAIVLKLEGK
jgi:hypothetical protein